MQQVNRHRTSSKWRQNKDGGPVAEAGRPGPRAPREKAPCSHTQQPPAREKPLPRCKGRRAQPPMVLQREPPWLEPPPLLSQLFLQPSPRGLASRAEPSLQPQPGDTVRLELVLTEPTDHSCMELSYPELLLLHGQQEKLIPTEDPLNDGQRETQEVKMLAKRLEMKYGGKLRKRRKDRLQDCIDIGFGYDARDPFIDNSEAYDEFVPASLTTMHGGFYINAGTLEFRQVSDTEEEEEQELTDNPKHKPPKVPKVKEDAMETKKRKRKA